jgi:polyisoprenoid-binding protein YceI
MADKICYSMFKHYFYTLKYTTMSKWIIDSVHSEVGFKVKHLVISNASGKFSVFEGTVETAKEDFSDAKISFSADIDSINTGQEQRDGHLKSADFFNAEKYPKLSFVSSSLTPVSGSEYKLKGDFTMHGVTKPIELDVDFGGVQKDLYGQTVAGFEITGKIKRSDFGLSWSAVTEAGGLVLGEDVKLHINAELINKN